MSLIASMSPGRPNTCTETIARAEEWVDTNYGVDASGSALYLDMSGKTKLNFAEVTFDDGHVQVVDFNEETHDPGVYKLLDVNANQHVATVRGLGLRRIRQTVELEDTPQVRGMINRVNYLVRIED